jgi:pimeloyl-ACP methyl ester carboxylesterase
MLSLLTDLSQVGGIILASTCLDSEGPRLKAFGGLELTPAMLPVVTDLTSSPNRDFSLPAGFTGQVMQLGLGPGVSEADVNLFEPLMARTYSGDEGRLRLRQSTINLISRDSLHLRLSAITCPVLWIQGTEDKSYPVDNAKEELPLMKSKDSKLEVIEGGQHLLSWSHSVETNKLIIEFLGKHSVRVNARALREAVGMVDM